MISESNGQSNVIYFHLTHTHTFTHSHTHAQSFLLHSKHFSEIFSLRWGQERGCVEWMLFWKTSWFSEIFFFFFLKTLPSDRLLLSENTLERDQSTLSPTHFPSVFNPYFSYHPRHWALTLCIQSEGNWL